MLTTLKADFSKDPPKNDLEHLISWKIDSGSARSVAPHIAISLEKYLIENLRNGTPESLNFAFSIAPLSSLVTFQQALHSDDRRRSDFLWNCAINRLPDDSGACLNIAKCLIEVENRAGAEAAIEKGISLGALPSDVQSIRDRVGKVASPGHG